MNARAPRHRGPQSAEVRRAERQGLLALNALPFLLALLVWLVVRIDSPMVVVLSALGGLIGSLIGRRTSGKTKARRRTADKPSGIAESSAE